MATTDLERLVVSLDASFVKYERAWAKAQGLTAANTNKLRSKFDGVSKAINSVGGNTRGLERVGLQTGNIAAQFQDIAVQLQSGQSPFTIALQQGTQLSAALGSQAGLKGTVAALGAGFASMVNPVSLATIAIIGLGGAAVQWLTQTKGEVEDTNKTVDEHIKRIKEIARGYTAAEDAANRYIAEAEKLPQDTAEYQTQKSLTDAQNALAASLEKVRDNYLEAALTQEAFSQTALTQGKQAAIEQRDALLGIQKAAQETNPDLDALALSLQKFIDNNPNSLFRNLAQNMLVNVQNAQAFAKEVGVARTQLDNLPRTVQVRIQLATNFSNAMQELKDLAPELRSSFDVAREAADAAFQKGSVNAQSIAAAQSLAKQYQETLATIDEAERRSQAKSAGSGASSIDTERKAVEGLIADLQAEYDQVGMTAEQKEIANALRQAGAAATDQERQKIVELITATNAEQGAIDRTQEAMKQFADISRDALGGFISDLRNGKSATEALGNALSRIADNLINIGLNTLFSSIFPFANGGIAAHGKPLKTFAGGGVSRSAAIFGEAGPEAAVPLPDGRRIPVDLRMPALPANGGGTQALQVHVVSDDEKFGAYVTNKAGQVVAQSAPGIAGAAVKQANKSAPSAMARYQQQQQGSDYRV